MSDFNRWTVIDWARQRTQGRNDGVLCRCECGTERVVTLAALRSGNSKSCGCLRVDRVKRLKLSHGMAHHPAYQVWCAICSRCYCPSNKRFKRYGARGIQMAPDWAESFEAFWRDMGPTYQPGLSLDRIDDDKGYSKDNCRWATALVQNNNLSTSRLISTPWGDLTPANAAEKTGIPLEEIRRRLNLGWADDAVIQKDEDWTY